MNRRISVFSPVLVLTFCLFPTTHLRAEAEPSAETKPLAAVLQPFVDRQTLAGAVMLVADKDKILDLEAVGFANVAAKKPMTTDSLFWIASQSKTITATALMILVDEGKVNVQDPVEKYLPEFSGQMVAEKKAGKTQLRIPRHPMLIRNLLTHTSGLPFKSALEEPTLDVYPLADRVKSYAKAPLEFDPGTDYLYANAGLNTVGRIVEVVSGMPYEQFVQTRVLDPLQMKETTFRPTGKLLERLAKAYHPDKNGGLAESQINQLKYPLDDPQRMPIPSGGLFSTATDMSHFYQMLINKGEFRGKRIVSEEAIAQMTKNQVGDLHKTEYGFAIRILGDHIGHGGAMHTSSSIDTKNQIIEILLLQHAGWKTEGKNILPAFQNAAAKYFGINAKAGEQK